jgi:hypothetical protein
MWREDAADSGSSMSTVEAHRDAISHETGRHAPVDQVGRSSVLATLCAYTRDQSHGHREGALDPNYGKHRRSPASCHVPYRPANAVLALIDGRLEELSITNFFYLLQSALLLRSIDERLDGRVSDTFVFREAFEGLAHRRGPQFPVLLQNASFGFHERIALPMLGRLPVFPPPLDDQIEHGNKE